eukprot:9477624-Pyramimonas_sp.AAC.3
MRVKRDCREAEVLQIGPKVAIAAASLYRPSPSGNIEPEAAVWARCIAASSCAGSNTAPPPPPANCSSPKSTTP